MEVILEGSGKIKLGVGTSSPLNEKYLANHRIHLRFFHKDGFGIFDLVGTFTPDGIGSMFQDEKFPSINQWTTRRAPQVGQTYQTCNSVLIFDIYEMVEILKKASENQIDLASQLLKAEAKIKDLESELAVERANAPA